jgi:pimeloyl-ACP methyl ester carboxylesterase
MRPTIVLIHGAFTESSSWNGVAESLMGADYDVVAAANPLRGLSADAESVSDVVRSIEGPVVLVAHSYGGAVMTNVDAGASEIIGLVYVNGFAPEHGESCFGLAAMYPGSMLGEETARPVPRSDGTTDLYVAPGRFHDHVLPGRLGDPSRLDGDDAAPRHPGGARGAVGRAAAVEGRAVVVPDRRRGPHHPVRAAALHGRPRREPAEVVQPGERSFHHPSARGRVPSRGRCSGGRSPVSRLGATARDGIGRGQ